MTRPPQWSERWWKSHLPLGQLDLPGRQPPRRQGLDHPDLERGFGDWGQVFADPVVAAAIVDRLLGNAAVLNIRGKSYRMRAYQARAEAR